ncbi:MAG: carboxypeptidase regulatory-like domain-containing protein [Desulfamplus sp.]|nr:carboxypeptidase regulatory-like domain-containing protein [Desulfamplus sp.]
MDYVLKRLKWSIVFVLFACIATPAFSAVGTGTISGTVYDSSGTTPIIETSVYVSIYKPGICGKTDWVASIQTDTTNGTYTFSDVAPGSYYVRAESSATNYLTEWWASPLSQIAQSSAQTVLVSDGGAITGIDFQLDKGASISGTLYKRDGVTPVIGESVTVSLYNSKCGSSIKSTSSSSLDGTF